MKVSEIRDMTLDEMKRKVTDLNEELFNLRFRHGAGQLETPHKLRQTRKDIARIQTIMNETAKMKKTEKT